MKGVVLDESKAELKGNWTHGEGLKNYVGWGYHYASPDSDALADFRLDCSQERQIRRTRGYPTHANRAPKAAIDVLVDNAVKQRVTIDMRKTYDDGFASLLDLDVKEGQVVTVRLLTESAGGIVHADAAQLLPL